jgi:F0F1-type ATP synthase membrane subunit b/b'
MCTKNKTNSGGEMNRKGFDLKTGISANKKLSVGFILTVVLMALLLVSLTACQPTQETTPEAAPITQAPAVQEPPTATVTEANLEATQSVIDTAQAPATQTRQAMEAEATNFVAKLTEDAIASATAAVSAPVKDELAKYGLDSSTGHVAWSYQPLTLSADGYHVAQSSSDTAGLLVKDFVIAADITWDTEYSESGCGFTFRSNGNQDAPSEYRVVLTRSTDGHLFFNAISNGKVANYRDFYVNLIDPDFDWEVGATNHLAVVMKGNILQIYSNKKRVGEVDITTPPPKQPVLADKPVKPESPSSDLSGKDLQEAKKAYQQLLAEYKAEMEKYNEQVSKLMNEHNAILNAYSLMQGTFDEGQGEMLAYSSSGYAGCQFSNAWLWVTP